MGYVYARGKPDSRFARGEKLTWSEIIDEYVEYLDDLNRTEKHLYDVRNTLNNGAAWFVEQGILPIAVNKHLMRTHLRDYKRSGKSDLTVNHRATKFIALFRWAYMEEIFDTDRLGTFKKAKIEDKPRRDIPTLDEIGRIINAIHETWSPEHAPGSRFRSEEAREFFDVRDTCATLWMGETGSRVGETFEVRRSDVDLVKRVAILRNTKNGDTRVVPLTSEFCSGWLGKWIGLRDGLDLMSDYLFVTEQGLKIDPYSWGRSFNKYRIRAGIERRIRRHDLRHFASTAHDRVDRELSKKIIGHHTDAAHDIYSHRELSELQKVHDEAHPMGPLVELPPTPPEKKAKTKVYTKAK